MSKDEMVRNSGILAGDLKKMLRGLPDDAVVLVASDQEENSIRTVRKIELSLYEFPEEHFARFEVDPDGFYEYKKCSPGERFPSPLIKPVVLLA
jgi:DNA polymerase III sliding clamp (beta) subunit (PCNA family)